VKHKFPSQMSTVIIPVFLASMLYLWGCASPTEINLQPTLTSQPKAASTPSPTETPVPASSTPEISPTMIPDKDRMILLYVPAGEFIMGIKAEDALAECQKFHLDCQLDWFKDGEPPHTVNLDAFWIDQTEVTNAMYAKCVQDGKCDPPGSIKSFAGDSYYGNSEFDNYPVIFVSWEDATAYCSWANRRLPTEAEWEKAARGENALVYPWGNDIPDNNLLNYNGVMGNTTEVGKYPSGASPYGALDMAGNVMEWVADWYDASYYSNSPSSNPLGPDSGQDRVLRSSSWLDTGMEVFSASRGANDPTLKYDLVGFRCALSQ
jgi:formylglycine-generating enzyme required for sulfatase activity